MRACCRSGCGAVRRGCWASRPSSPPTLIAFARFALTANVSKLKLALIKVCDAKNPATGGYSKTQVERNETLAILSAKPHAVRMSSCAGGNPCRSAFAPQGLRPSVATATLLGNHPPPCGTPPPDGVFRCSTPPPASAKRTSTEVLPILLLKIKGIATESNHQSCINYVVFTGSTTTLPVGFNVHRSRST